MKLEDQVVSLNLAKRLKELNVKRESQFYHCNAKSIGEHVFEKEVWVICHLSQTTGHSDYWISAFTVAELVDILPMEIGNPHLEMRKCRDGSYGVEYLCLDNGYTNSEKFVDACAKMLINLIENDLLRIK